ncbi:MAG: A/G-specific adenine glycosylase [Myxococcota bacterium]
MKALRRALLAWFDRERRDLPWRRTKDPYAVWVSEVMLQQTQVTTVIPYFQRFMARFADVEALAAAPLDEVLSLWRGLGYYSRARALHRAAQEVVSHHGGQLPPTAAELRRLPGFGPYTAGAVASIAFGEEAPLVDGNVARVLSRLFVVKGAPGDKAREARLWELAGQLVRGPRPGDFNQALMELGALVCRVESPSCLLCPLRAHCAALAAGRVEELPPKRIRPPRKPLALAVAVWRKNGAFLFGRRESKGLFGGLWELPSTELRAGTEPSTALRAALGGRLRVGDELGTVKRTLTHRDLTLRLFEVAGARVPSRSEAYRDFRWATPAQARELGMSAAMQCALEAAARR